MNFPTSVTTFQVRSNFPTPVTTFQVHSNFPTPVRTFQLRSVRSNFAWFFPTSIGSFQLRLALSNFSETFQLQFFQLKTFQLLVLSDYAYPRYALHNRILYDPIKILQDVPKMSQIEVNPKFALTLILHRP